MTNDVKKGPGRPFKSRIDDEMEHNMNQLREVDANTNDTAPVNRGLREAAIRAQELRDRMRNNAVDPTMHDDFYIDPRNIPEGWDYNWKRESIAGQTDQEHMIEMRSAGWEPVDARRHPDLVPTGYTGAIRKIGRAHV